MLGSRILGGGALQGGMPLYKYVANRFLTLVENILLGSKLSEYHTGYRAFSRELLERAAAGSEFRRFRLRQPDAGADHLAGLHDRRGQLSDQVFHRGLLDQSAAQHPLRFRLSGNRIAFAFPE
ncbi:MAG: hypothetical protein MZV49_25705 [Rhodopseudomonas palustris]|nr:hypothetical protein [Rhodopseudomonas palustris]